MTLTPDLAGWSVVSCIFHGTAAGVFNAWNYSPYLEALSAAT